MHQRRVFNRYLRVDEEKKLLATVAQFGDPYARRDHAWMRFARQSGVRVSVLAGFTVADAKRALKEGYVFVRGEINKGDKSYSVYANKKCKQALRDLLALRREMGHAEVLDAPLIMGRNHAGMSVRSFQARMTQWVRAAGLTLDASPHWWRHTFAKRILQTSTAENPLAIVQQALGHSSITNTAIYTWPDKEDYEQNLEDCA